MKKFTLLLLLITSFSFSQVVLVEDFEGGSNSFTNNDIAGAGDIWTIESGGEATLASAGNDLVYSVGGAVGDYATFDSDANSNNMAAENVALESPVFSCATLTQVSLEYNHLFAGNFGGSGFVEVSSDGGTNWTTVTTYTADGYDGGRISTDVSAQLAGVTSAQVRFRWTGDFSVAWYVDNVTVFQCTVNAPTAVTTAMNPSNGATNVEINYGTTTNNIGPFEWMTPGSGDPADSFDLSLGTNLSGDDIGTIAGFPSGNSINFAWQPNTTYFWSISSVNCAGSTPGTIFSFTTSDCTDTVEPSATTTPGPTDGAIDVALDASDNGLIFNWTAGDSGDDFVLNLGTADPPDQSFNNFQNGGRITGLAENTTYFWSVDAVNCFGSTPGPIWSFTTGLALSVKDNDINVFTLYPNPTSDILNIKTELVIDQINIFNILGQKINTFNNIDPNSKSIDISDLSKGLYLIEINSGNQSETIRILKE